MKKIRTLLIGCLGLLLFWLIPTQGYAKEPAGQIVISVEKATLGQGYIIEPQYAPFYEGESVAEVTLRVLKENGLKYYNDGNEWSVSFYLADVWDPDRGEVSIPQYITNSIKQAGLKLYEDYTPDYLGEFDYTRQSGWMYTVNGEFPIYSAGAVKAANNQVVRWQFTLMGMGRDTGGDPSLKDNNTIDMTKLYRSLAAIRKDSELLKDTSIRTAYENCLKYAIQLDVSNSLIYSDSITLETALAKNVLTNVSFYDSDHTSSHVKYGTKLEQIDFPSYLRAVKHDGTKEENINLTNISWECKDGYQEEVPGIYQFSPNLPKEYRLKEGVELPTYQVYVHAQGDVNQDSLLNEADIEAILPYLGTSAEADEDETIYDIDSDTYINLKDYSIIVGAVNDSKTDTEGDSRLQLRFEKDSYHPGETVTASVMLYSAVADTIAMNLTYDPNDIQNVSFSGEMQFQLEKLSQTDASSMVVFGRRNGEISTNTLEGLCIGKVTFTWSGSEGTPQLAFTKSNHALMEGNTAIGYRNGHKIALETDHNYSTDLRLLCQLNTGRVRKAEFTQDVIQENGRDFFLINITFQHTDAQDVAQNRLRIRAQLPGESTLVIGGRYENGEITELLTEKNGIYYAEGEAGCFTGGCSPQKETAVLYGKLVTDGIETFYKINVQRTGYAAIFHHYSESQPLLLNQWDASAPALLSGNWSLEAVDLKGWDSEGNPRHDLALESPSLNSADELYLVSDKVSDKTSGTLYAQKGGDYWLSITDETGKVQSKVRIHAVYPYEAADYYLKLAERISLNPKDYRSSVQEKLAEYQSAIDQLKKIQENYPTDQPLYAGANGQYSIEDTGTVLKDSYGYALTTDSIRTNAVNELRTAIDTLQPQLEAGLRIEIRAALRSTSYVYDGTAKTPGVTVTDQDGKTVSAKNYTITYKNNVNAGSGQAVVVGKGDYTGKVTLKFTIRKATQTVTAKTRSFTKQVGDSAFTAGVRASGKGTLVYRSSNPSIVKVSSSGKIQPLKKGTASITVYAKANANYQQSSSIKLTVKVLAVPDLKVSKTSFTKTYGDSAFSLGIKVSKGASYSCKVSDTKVVTVSKTGKVSIKGPGKATITVSAKANGMGTAVKKITVTVKPKKLAAPTLKSSKSKQLTASWKRDSKATGYILEIASDQKFTKKVLTQTISKNQTVSYTAKGLKGKTTYYVRIRSYKKSSGGTVYSSWSSVKNIKTKE